MSTNQHYPTYYETSIHDKTVGFIAQQVASITQLSEGSINDIRFLFNRPVDFRKFCAAWVDITLGEIDRLTDQIYPEHEDEIKEYVEAKK